MVTRAASSFSFAVMVNPRTGAVFLDRLLEYKLWPALVVTRDPFYAGDPRRVARQLQRGRMWLRYLTSKRGFEARYDTWFAARRHGLATFPAQAVNSRACAERLRALDLDYIFVFSFPLLADFIFSVPRCGTINFHPSLLPRHRGPEPIFWTVRGNDGVAGISFHYIDEGVDTGRIIAQYPIAVDGQADSAALSGYLSSVGARRFMELIYRLRLGYPPERGLQADSAPTHERGIRESDKSITPEMTADEVICVVRAAREFGLAGFSLAGRERKIVDAFVLPGAPDGMAAGVRQDELGNICLRSADGRVLYLVTGD